MGNLSIGRSLIIRQLLYISVLVTVSVAAYFGSLQLRDLAHEALTASPATMHLYAVQIDQAATKLNRDLIFVSALGSLLVLLVSMPIAYFTIARPVDKLARQMSVLAGGDVDIEIDGTERKDEIGAISRALRVLRDGVKKTMSWWPSSMPAMTARSGLCVRPPCGPKSKSSPPSFRRMWRG